MRTIRIFVSSPGDVQRERKLADTMVRSIAAELGIPVSVSYSNLLRAEEVKEQSVAGGEDRVVLCPYFWEYQRFTPDQGYQEQIPNTAEFDLVICILWSRLGTELAPKFTLPDGSRPKSGTDYEIAWAVHQSKKTHGTPALHIYRNRTMPNFPLEPEDQYQELVYQWKSLKNFFASWEKDSEGHFIAAFNNYSTLDEFEDLFRAHFRDYLVSQLDKETASRTLVHKSKRWDDNPFRGLEVFEFEHAPIFHGRTKAIGEVLDLVVQLTNTGTVFVLVLGASGSGKSSLVRAGVLPLLTEPGTIEGIGLWRRAVTKPAAAGAASDPFDALAAALLAPAALPELADQEASEPIKELAHDLRENPTTVELRVRDALGTVALLWKNSYEQTLQNRESEMRATGRVADAELAQRQRQQLAQPRTRLVLVVDQIEELFTTGFSAEVQQKYVAAITSLARGGRVYVIATLRSDFYARYQEFPELVELAKQGRFDLRPPGATEIGAIIRWPAEAAGLAFEKDPETGQPLDEGLRDAAAKNPESLPLLEHALDRLFQAQAERKDGILLWSDYRRMGGLEGALATHAEAVFQQLQAHEQDAFPIVLRQLVTLGQGEEEVANRRTAPYRDFCTNRTQQEERARAQGFVDLFVSNRLLVADADPHGNVVISVAHEALLREWDRVKTWLAANRDFLRMRNRLDASLENWKERGRQKYDLLQSGLPLAEGEKLLSEFDSSLSPEQIDYIQTSSAEQHRQRRRRNRVRNGILTAVSVLAIAAGIQWWRAEQEKNAAQEAQHREEQVRYSLYKSAFEIAHNDGRHEEAALWLRQALDLGGKNGLATSADDTTLKAEIDRVNWFTWSIRAAPAFSDVFQFKKNGELWALDSTSSSLLCGLPSANGSLKVILDDVGEIQGAAAWKSGGKILLLIAKKLLMVDPDTHRVEKTLYLGEHQPAIYVDERMGTVFVSADGDLLEIALSRFEVSRRWKLNLEPSTKLWNLIVDDGQGREKAVLQISVPNANDWDRRLAVFDLSKNKIVRTLYRSGGSKSEFRLTNGHSIFASDDGEIVQIDLRTLEQSWKKRLPWGIVAVEEGDAESFLVVCQDGLVRRLKFSGDLVQETEMAGITELDAFFPIADGYFLFHDGAFSVRPSLTSQDLTRSKPFTAGVSRAVPIDDKRFAILKSHRVQLRNLSDGSLLREWDISGNSPEDLIRGKDGSFFLRQGASISRYDPNFRRLAGEIDGVLATCNYLLVSQSQADSTESLIAATSAGVYAFDAATLSRREKLLSGTVDELCQDQDGIWMVTKDTIFGRVQISRYSWGSGKIDAKVELPCEASEITALHFGVSTKELFLGFQDGTISVLSLKSSENPDEPFLYDDSARATVPAIGVEPVTGLWCLPENHLVVGRSDGSIQLFGASSGTQRFELEANLRPFGNNQVQNIIASSPVASEALLCAQSDFGLFHFNIGASQSWSMLHPTQNSCYCPSCLASPYGVKVSLTEDGGGETFLETGKATTNEFWRVAVSPSQKLVAAGDSAGSIYIWKLDTASGNRAQSLGVFATACSGLRFLDDSTLVAGALQQVAYINVSSEGTPTLRWKRAPAAAGTNISFASESLAATETKVFAVSDAKPNLFYFDARTGDTGSYPLSFPPRSVSIAGKSHQFLLVGGDNRVVVLSLPNLEKLRTITLPEVNQRYYIRSMLGLPASDFAAIGGRKNLFMVNLLSGNTVFTEPVADYIWGMRLDPESQTLYWWGEQFYGRLRIPNPTVATPTMAKLEDWLGMRLLGASMIVRVERVDFDSVSTNRR